VNVVMDVGICGSLAGSAAYVGSCSVFSQSLGQTLDFGHCGVEYHASFPKQTLSSTLEKSRAATRLHSDAGL
jgi:hypothetical protein